MSIDLFVPRAVIVHFIDDFLVSDYFRRGVVNGVEIQIGSIGNNFTLLFADQRVGCHRASRLLWQDLGRSGSSQEIMRTLGGETKIETNLAEIYFLLRRQNEGQEGFLLTNGQENLFYVRDSRGELCIIGVRLHLSGWMIGALKEEQVKLFIAKGTRVFFRESI